MYRKRVFAWALYDWANSAFATTVMAGFFPVFFKNYWSVGVAATESTFRLGLANSIASLVIVLLAPLLGAMADRAGARKRFLLAFASLGVVMTGGLSFVEQGEWWIAASLYLFAGIGFAGGNIFYDALIVGVAGPKDYDRVSAFGFALGYLGGGVLFAVNVAMSLWPAAFGLSNAAEAVRVSFLMVALWWVVFSLPLFLFVQEPAAGVSEGVAAAVRGGWRQLVDTFRQIRALKVVALFLAAYWCYIDAVDTIIRMAVDYGLSLGFDFQHLIVALLITQFVGFPAALVFGRIGTRFGPKRAVLGAIAVYIAVTLWAMTLDTVADFYGLAVAIGLVQGGVQALSRSLYARIIPADKSAEFFGFYNMLGKFAAVLGPLLMGAVGLISGSARVALLAVVVLFAVGALLLCFVDVERGREMARTLERRLPAD
ncbi:MAG TPA: MFS transporter [Gammaproteobacteria bacterium]|nr:MFS transporter [Gammaproteobacteria bacterium]